MTYGLGMAELVHGDVKRSNSPAPPISPPYANHPDRTTARSDTPSSCNPFATNVKSFGYCTETYRHARKSQGGSPGELHACARRPAIGMQFHCVPNVPQEPIQIVVGKLGSKAVDVDTVRP